MSVKIKMYVNNEAEIGLPEGYRGDEPGTKYLLRKKGATLGLNIQPSSISGSYRPISLMASSGAEELYAFLTEDLEPGAGTRREPRFQIGKYNATNYEKTDVDVSAVSALNANITASSMFWDAANSVFVVMLAELISSTSATIRVAEVDPSTAILSLTGVTKNISASALPRARENNAVMVTKNSVNYVAWNDYSAGSLRCLNLSDGTLNTASLGGGAPNVREAMFTLTPKPNGDVLLGYLGNAGIASRIAPIYMASQDKFVVVSENERDTKEYELYDPEGNTISGLFTVDISSVPANSNSSRQVYSFDSTGLKDNLSIPLTGGSGVGGAFSEVSRRMGLVSLDASNFVAAIAESEEEGASTGFAGIYSKISIDGLGALTLGTQNNVAISNTDSSVFVGHGNSQQDMIAYNSTDNYIPILLHQVSPTINPNERELKLVDDSTMTLQTGKTQDQFAFIGTLTQGPILNAAYTALWMPPGNVPPKEISLLLSNFDGGKFDTTTPNKAYIISIETGDSPGNSQSDNSGQFSFEVVGVIDVTEMDPAGILDAPGRVLELDGFAPGDFK